MAVKTELRFKGTASHLLVGFPPHDIQDARFMSIEQRMGNVTSAQELPARLPQGTRKTSSSPPPTTDYHKNDPSVFASQPHCE